MGEPTPTARRLGQELQRLLDLAGVSGREMARRTGTAQPTLSRMTRGEAPVRLPVARRWLDECGADDETRARVLALAETALAETRPWRDLFAEEGHLQSQVRDLDLAARLVRNFAPTVLPGLLQTAAYAAGVLRMGRTTDVPAAVAARLQRQDVLHQPDRRFEFVLTERVLGWGPVAGALAGQADRLRSLATLDNVELRVLSDGASLDVVAWHNFVIRYPADGSPAAVAAELQHGAQHVTDAESVAIYESVWRHLWEAADPWARFTARHERDVAFGGRATTLDP